MQKIDSIERSGGGGERRLRPHHQDLNCPRCDSSNTKFCYYNNYNLSQPRHFCKSCRRYWTKGGVLRNVPVGGGIRKTKRYSMLKSKNNIPSSDAAIVAPSNHKSSNSGNSSSDSSSLTANTTATASISMISTPPTLLNFNKSMPVTTFDLLTLDQSSAGNMSSEIGRFTSLIMTSSTDQLPLAFNSAASIPSFQLHHHNNIDHVVENQYPNQLQWTHTDVKMPKMGSSGFMGSSGLESRRSNGGLAGTEDWQDSVDEGLVDLTGTLDQSYWNQSQWNDDHHNHHHLNYLP